MNTTARVSTPRSTLPLLAFLLAFPAVAAAEGLCGTHPFGLELMLAHHLQNRRTVSAKSAPRVTRSGHVAAIEDDGTLVSRPNPFDLASRSFQFLRRPKGMSAVRSKLGGGSPRQPVPLSGGFL